MLRNLRRMQKPRSGDVAKASGTTVAAFAFYSGVPCHPSRSSFKRGDRHSRQGTRFRMVLSTSVLELDVVLRPGFVG